MSRTEPGKREQTKKRRLLIAYVAVSIIILLGAIIPFAPPRDSTISGNGTIRFINLEGGFYGITADNGINYDPTNLGDGYQQDGLKVTFEGKIRTDLVNAHQWGTILELTRIGKAP